jgi:hypothetical protein
MPETAGYGFGLFLVSNAAIGTRVSHGGGYPGFGTHMAWHPTTGLGVIALGNVRYAPVHDAVVEELTALVRAGSVPRRPLRLLPSVEAFRPVVEGLLAAWNDDEADAAFAMNMDLDEPREVRRAAVAALAAQLGPFHADETRPSTSDSPAHLAWWLRGTRGWVRASILVSPEPEPRLQAMRLSGVPDPSGELRAAAARLLAAAGERVPAWPADLAPSTGLDVPAVERSLMAAAARLGRIELGLPTAGDGVSTATFEAAAAAAETLPGSAPLAVTVALDQDGAVASASVRFAEHEAPVEPW